MIGKRVHALIIFKQNELTGISKREVAQLIGVNHNSIQSWRNLYISGGIELLIKHSKKGYKPSVITFEEEEALREQMFNPENGFVGYAELLAWFDEKFAKQTNYSTFKGFVYRKFNSKIKVARKVHVKKDQVKVEAFKKTSVKNVKISTTKKDGNSKK
ncbi:MAG: transposase [Saprospiraceae bacterium]